LTLFSTEPTIFPLYIYIYSNIRLLGYQGEEREMKIKVKCCSFEISTYQTIMKKCITISTKIGSDFATDFNIDDNNKTFFLSSKSSY